MRQHSLSVIIPNYNGASLLQKNLPSVISALEKTGIQYELIIVDDCSTDNSRRFILDNYPGLNLISRETNGGFSAACNTGADAANFEYILFLNSDIELPDNYFEGQFDYFEDPEVFGVTAKIIGINGEVQDTARMLSRKGYKIKADTFFNVEPTTNAIPTAYLSGANALVDAEKFRQMGKFNEIFSPFYYEDFELGLRAWRMGWKCIYHPHTYCIHDHSSTTRNYKTAGWVKSIFFRNRFIMHALHLNDRELKMWRLQLLMESFFKMLAGNFFIRNAYSMYCAKKNAIQESRLQMDIQMKKCGSNLSIDEVIRKMQMLLADFNINTGRK